MDGHFATTMLPRGLPILDAARYSGIPARRLWAYIAEGRLRAIRLPGVRRVLLDRSDLDALLEASKVDGS
jgi:excisionase family DNA binding protein